MNRGPHTNHFCKIIEHLDLVEKTCADSFQKLKSRYNVPPPWPPSRKLLRYHRDSDELYLWHLWKYRPVSVPYKMKFCLARPIFGIKSALSSSVLDISPCYWELVKHQEQDVEQCTRFSGKRMHCRSKHDFGIVDSHRRCASTHPHTHNSALHRGR